jgi:hypothetical protein
MCLTLTATFHNSQHQPIYPSLKYLKSCS